MKFANRFSFWLMLISIGICWYNYQGFDDKNILLYITNIPNFPLQIFKQYYFYPRNEYMLYYKTIRIVYVFTIGYWFSVGILIDQIIKFIKEKF